VFQDSANRRQYLPSRAMINSVSLWRFGVGGSNGGAISRSSCAEKSESVRT
jgi:hypothetical protein